MNKLTIIITITLILTLLITTNVWADERKKTIDKLITEGRNAAVFQEYKKAEKFYEEAVNLKSAQAAYLLATHCMNGYGQDVNIDKAIYWYKKAIELGYSRANYELGVVYHKYKHNIELAQKYFEQAIDLGDIDAYHDLAIMHINKKEYRKALILLTHSKVEHHAASQFTLAQFYLFNIQVTKDTNKAIQLLNKAADSNYAPAVAQLGRIYVTGEFTAKNLTLAEMLFEKNYRLEKKNGLDLAEVLFIQKKIPQAKALLEKMAQGGDETASAMLKNLN